MTALILIFILLALVAGFGFATFKIIGRFNVGSYPEHITPAWDGEVRLLDGGRLPGGRVPRVGGAA